MELIVLASGSGKRLKRINPNRPKCLLKISDDKTILDYTGKIFKKFNTVYLVGGYKFQLLKRFEKKNVKLIFNKDFKNSNMVQSLYKVKNLISSDIIVIYSDILFDLSIVNELKNKKNNVIPLKKNWLQVWRARMSEKEIIKANIDTETICCDGSKDSLGDPAEYFTFDS